MTRNTTQQPLRKHHAYPQEVRQQAIALHDQGLGAKRISRELGIDSSVIKEWLRRYREFGADSLKPWWRKSTSGIHKSADFAERHARFDEPLRLYMETDMKCTDICRRCGVDYASFYYFLHRYHYSLVEARHERVVRGEGHLHSPAPEGKGKPKESTAERYRRSVELYRTSSLTVKEIAARTGVNEHSFRYHLVHWHRNLMLERSRRHR